MSRPIKISDGLYARLKAQAEAAGVTLQDALVELLSEPHSAIATFERQLNDLRSTVESQRISGSKAASEVAQLRKDVSTLSERISSVESIRAKDASTFNSWVDTWREIPRLADDIGDALERLDSLEELAHRHFWQEVED